MSGSHQRLIHTHSVAPQPHPSLHLSQVPVYWLSCPSQGKVSMDSCAIYAPDAFPNCRGNSVSEVNYSGRGISSDQVELLPQLPGFEDCTVTHSFESYSTIQFRLPRNLIIEQLQSVRDASRCYIPILSEVAGHRSELARPSTHIL